MFNIIFIIFKLIVFWFILFFSGYQLAKWLFKKEKIETLIAFSGLIGASLYIFLINIIGHFVEIRVTFYLILLTLFLGGVFLFIKNKEINFEWGIDKKWRKILLTLALLLVVATFIIDNRRPIGGDETLPLGMPAAVTMAEGNFPARATYNPSYPLRYHYGRMLFAAAINKTTDLPLYIGYDIQVAILVGILFLLGFILINRFIKHNKKALIASILMLYSGGLIFIAGGIEGISNIYHKYILHQDIASPFKFVFGMFEALFSASAYQRIIEYPTYAFGFAIIVAATYVYFSLEKIDTKFILLNILFLSTLALFAETLLAVLSLLFLVYPFILGILKKDWQKAKTLLINSLIILIFVWPIAFTQGGVLPFYLGMDGHNLKLYQTFGHTDTELLNRGFDINKEPWILMTRIGDNKIGKDGELPIYYPQFLTQWGLLLFLVIGATIYFWKRYSNELFFFILAFFGFFVIPFFILFPLLSCSMERFFYPANLFGGLIVGLFFSDLYFKEENSRKKWLKGIVIFLTALLVLQGLIFQLLFLTIGYPPGKWNNADKFFAKNDSFERKIYQWVGKNTNVKDYFLIIEPERDDYGMEGKSPNLRFVLNTGRLAPTYNYFVESGPIFTPQPAAFGQLKKDCYSEIIKYLNYKYLYVTQDYPAGLEEKCLANNKLELKFEIKENNKFVRIYKIIY